MKSVLVTYASLVVGAAALLALLTGCDAGKVSEPFQDAPRGHTNGEAADVIEMPDGFSNAATKCDHGNRVYVIFKEDATYGSIAVVPNDRTCR